MRFVCTEPGSMKLPPPKAQPQHGVRVSTSPRRPWIGQTRRKSAARFASNSSLQVSRNRLFPKRRGAGQEVVLALVDRSRRT